MTILEKVWYESPWYKLPLMLALLPLTLLFFCVSAIRRGFYRCGILSAKRVSVPVVVVGNISVGGNGKTPIVVLLAKWLSEAGYRPGVLSRGYGGNATSYPMAVTTNSVAEQVGDEPVLMRQNLTCPMVVDPIRSRGAEHLIDEFDCDIIICDDGLQHYALKRDVEIIVMDGKRRLGNGWLMPMGPLREGAWRLKTTEFVINNGGSTQQGESAMRLEPGNLVNLQSGDKTKSYTELKKPVVAAAGIGNPSRFFDYLVGLGIEVKERLSFPDHHQFKVGDLPDKTVIMTEKDAVKCRHIASEDWWYLPVTATLPDEFKQQLLAYLGAVKNRE